MRPVTGPGPASPRAPGRRAAGRGPCADGDPCAAGRSTTGPRARRTAGYRGAGGFRTALRVAAPPAAAAFLAAGVLGLATAPPAPAGAAVPRLSPQEAGSVGLGGWSLTATAAGMRATYEQPNFPVPATPSLEGDVGYSVATLGSGPVGEATASELWPGEVVASSGGQLGVIVPGAPALPNWPVQAHTAYPGGQQTASDDRGPVAMDATSRGPSSKASASVGTPKQAALPAGLVKVGRIGSSSTTAATASRATATATSSAAGIVLAGGLVRIASVATDLSGWSTGGATTYHGSTVAAGVTVAGQRVTVDASGVHAGSHDVPIGLAGLTPLQVLQQAGISMRVMHVDHSKDGPSGWAVPGGSDTASGLQIRIDLSTYDADFLKLVAELPSQLSSVLYQLPVPAPDGQVVTVDLGWTEVAAAASPGFVPPPLPPPPPPTPVAIPPVAAPPAPAAGGSTPVAATSGGSGAPSAPTPAPARSSGPAPRKRSAPGPVPLPATAVPTVFRGVGVALVGLGALGAAGFAMAVMRADRRLFSVVRRRACAGIPAGEATGGQGGNP